jgi:peroxiredoxin Q/BCP
MAEIKPGMKAPDFVLPGRGGREVALKDFRGKKVVLYFYPRDNTPGCTKEACSFQDSLSRLKRENAVVIGISPDSVGSHDRFAEKFGLSFPLVSDEKKDIARLYGVWKQKAFMGRKFLGVVRSTFIIDEDGRISHAFRNVKVDGHTDEVLRALQSS